MTFLEGKRGQFDSKFVCVDSSLSLAGERQSDRVSGDEAGRKNYSISAIRTRQESHRPPTADFDVPRREMWSL